MNYIPTYTTQFQKDVAVLEGQKKDLKKLVEVMQTLLMGKTLMAKYHPTKLPDEFKGHSYCNPENEVGLIYKISGREVIFERVGKTKELFY